jgi:hypothetical protein
MESYKRELNISFFFSYILPQESGSRCGVTLFLKAHPFNAGLARTGQQMVAKLEL